MNRNYYQKKNENKRFNNNNKYSNHNNYNTNGIKSGSNVNNKGVNDLNENKGKQINKDLIKCENNLDQNMPGIAVNRSLSSPPFVSINTDIKGDQKNGAKNDTIETNVCNNGSGDQNNGQKNEKLDKIVKQLEIGLNDIKIKDKDVIEDKNDSNAKTDLVNNNREKNGNNNIRRNTTGNADSYRYKDNRRQFNTKQYNTNDNNFQNHYNTVNNKFYRNYDRNNGSKYDSNEMNRKFNGKPFKSSNALPNTSSVDFGQNSNPFMNPNIYYWNGFEYIPSLPYLPPNQYPIYSSTAYPLQQSMALNSDQMAVNPKETEVYENNGQEIDYSKNANGTNGCYSVSFVPFHPTPAIPSPPIYLGFINNFVDKNGVQLHYFVSQFPPNIVPLKLDVDSDGMPILPSNCKISYYNN